MSPISFWMPLAFALLGMLMHPFISACPSDERNYLLDFKRGFIDYSGRLSSWQGFNCCQWKGIVCDSHSSHVIALDLNNYGYKHNNVSGEIHQSLFKLQHLQHLDLGYNNFNLTPISPQFAKLNRLTFLSLSSAGFAGEIPVELGNITTLRHLDLSASIVYVLESKRFKTWIQNLKSLEYLSMGRVNLTKASEHWGETLSSLSNLTHLDLSFCGLSGTIPSLLNLTRLSHLHLRSNSFPFPVPAWFQNVSSLVSLALSFCGLNGSIPSNFLHRSNMNIIYLSGYSELTGNLSFILNHSSSLTVLWMTDTGVSGVIPPSIGNFQKLQLLNLGRNRLTGDIPVSVAELVRLEELGLSSNNLTGSYSISMFQNLTQLRELDLSGNHFTVGISASWLPPFDHLSYLGLGSCNIQGDFPTFLSTQYFLEELNLPNNQIEGNVPNWLWDLPYLGNLNLSNNQLRGSLPPLNLSELKFDVFDLHNNSFHGSIPAVYFDASILDLSDNSFNGSIPATNFPWYYLSLSGNNLSGGIPHSICTDSNVFRILDLSRNNLKAAIPTNLGRCFRLSVLNLAHNDFQGEMPEELGNLIHLETLNLNGNNLQGTIPSNISNCAHLKVFDIGHNQIQGTVPVWLKELTALKILSLTFNKFEGSIPPQLMVLQNLQVLDLSHNKLTGTIPTNLGNLSAMVNQSQSVESQYTGGKMYRIGTLSMHTPIFMDQITLWIKGRELQYPKIWRSFKFMDLSHNKLSGDIPVEMGLLEGLIALNISKNNLSGSIPKSLEGMVHLESLDLSGNVLSGKIPAELVSLTFLSVLNLSDNMLSGLIPQGKQFSTFGASSFVGNPNLHGFPLENGTQSSGVGERGSHVAGVDEDGVGEADEMEKWWEVAGGYVMGWDSLL